MGTRFYLIGYMASGKSFLGRTVAGMLEMSFVDLDREIESMAGKGIPEIFSSEGEQAFRQYESDALKKTGRSENMIIATGGGTPCFGDNMEWMNAHGETIFLDAPVDVLADRIVHSKHVRPLVAGIPAGELPGFISKHLAGRLPFYHEAQHVLSIFPEKEKNVRNLYELLLESMHAGKEDV